MPCWLEIERVTAPLVRRFYEIWERKRTGHRMPRRGDFDPAELKDLLPNLLIIEPQLSPFRLRYRLVGTRIARVSGYDFTGRYLDEILRPDSPDDWHGFYRLSYERGCSVFGSIDCPTRDGGTFTYEFGIYPLRLGGNPSGAQVEQFFSVEDYGGREPYVDELIWEGSGWEENP